MKHSVKYMADVLVQIRQDQALVIETKATIQNLQASIAQYSVEALKVKEQAFNIRVQEVRWDEQVAMMY